MELKSKPKKCQVNILRSVWRHQVPTPPIPPVLSTVCVCVGTAVPVDRSNVVYKRQPVVPRDGQNRLRIKNTYTGLPGVHRESAMHAHEAHKSIELNGTSLNWRWCNGSASKSLVVAPQ